ncbi:MAG TPA: hypothetical protein PKO06_12675 [Candidatus Ozemobacteraceae bacterium]|nr:hypothetical protein [Candidatus Ozemobacteraceae bacterium]
MKKTLLCAFLALTACIPPGYGASALKPEKWNETVEHQQARISELEQKLASLSQQMADLQKSLTSEMATLKSTSHPQSACGDVPESKTAVSNEACEQERQEIADLDNRLEEIERIGGRIHHTGWYDFVVRTNNKPGDKRHFDQAHLYLNFDSQLDRVWRAFMELEIEHSPTANSGGVQGTIELDRGYIERRCGDLSKMFIGKFFVPLGLYTREHWAISTDSIMKPIHDENMYVPNSPVGFMYQGALRQAAARSGRCEYSCFLTNGSEMYATNRTRDDQLGGGADLRLNFGHDDRNRVGMTYYRQNNHAQQGRLEQNYLTFLDYYVQPRFSVRVENFTQNRDRRWNDVYVLYAGAKYQLSRQTYLHCSWNKGDDDKNGRAADQTIECLTLGWWPKPYVRTKLEFSRHRFEDPSLATYNQLAGAIGVVF